MIAKSIEIVKKERVQTSGSVCVRAGQGSGVAPRPAAAGQPSMAHVRIVESAPDHAVIEVVCSCGQKIHIQCQYANTVKTQ